MNNNKDKNQTNEQEQISTQYKRPFDIEQNSFEEILYNCGKFGLPKENALSLYRLKLSKVEFQRLELALQDAESNEMQIYSDGVIAGETLLQTGLFQNVIDGEKDAYKSYSAEQRRKAVNKKIEEHFGISEE